ncbi:MAG: CPBP family intramembrane metalloprotease [Clostridiales bacterium]|nr:CPBP family intramembrane metalloprotease [Clostridiales bacterium]
MCTLFAASIFEQPAEAVGTVLDAAELLLEQPEVRVLAVNTLFLMLLCVVALLFYVLKKTRALTPIGTGLESLTLMAIGCLSLAFIEIALQPSFLLKTLCKVTLFVACIFLYQVTNQSVSMLRMFRLGHPRQLLWALGGGLLVYFFILCAFWLFRRFIDLSVISNSLVHDSSVNAGNFLGVSLYISFVNSLLEEIFFRGYAFLALRESVPEVYAGLLSAIAFSLYHFAAMAGWFSPWLFLLLLIGLFVSGLLFNWMDAKPGNIYNSWLVHMFANFAINTIGFFMFGMLQP